MGNNLPSPKNKMAPAAILKNRKFTIKTTIFNRYSSNSITICKTAYYMHKKIDRYSYIEKYKMAAAAILSKRKTAVTAAEFHQSP